MNRKDAMAAVRANPRDADAWTVLGNVMAAEGDRDKARECYERALALVPDHPAAAIGLSYLDASPLPPWLQGAEEMSASPSSDSAPTTIHPSITASSGDLPSERLTIDQLNLILRTSRNLSSKNLSGMDLQGLDFRKVNLSGANLSSTNLSGSNLRDCNLAGADLRGARLTGVTYRERTSPGPG